MYCCNGIKCVKRNLSAFLEQHCERMRMECANGVEMGDEKMKNRASEWSLREAENGQWRSESKAKMLSLLFAEDSRALKTTGIDP